MAKKPTTKSTVKPTTKAPAKAPKKAVQVKISVKPVKNPMLGEKAMPMMPSGKKTAVKSTPNMMKQVAAIEKKTTGKPKTAIGKPFKGKK